MTYSTRMTRTPIILRLERGYTNVGGRNHLSFLSFPTRLILHGPPYLQRDCRPCSTRLPLSCISGVTHVSQGGICTERVNVTKQQPQPYLFRDLRGAHGPRRLHQFLDHTVEFSI